MAVVKPFKALRANPSLVEQINCLPYDVMNRQEAKVMASHNPYSFLHVTRSEIDLEDSIDEHDSAVYYKAKSNLKMFEDNEYLLQDKQEMFYVYRQTMDNRSQTGIVAICSVDDYLNNIIKKHEYTREEKELDRINHFDYCDANTEPIFLTFRHDVKLQMILQEIVLGTKEYDFISDDNIKHEFWVIDNCDLIKEIEIIFNKMDYLYIADGHHRSASAAKVAMKRREENPDFDGSELFNYFMCVLFPDDELLVMDYNRVVKDLNGHSFSTFMELVSQNFTVTPLSQSIYKPTKKHEFGMYLNKKWFMLVAKEESFDNRDEVNSLDAAILQNNLLEPILGIDNPRTNNRIDFIGGIRGIEELVKRCENDMEVAFCLFPTSILDLMQVADNNNVMPPKSTWFEPKLRSGLFINKLK